jgi:iron complex outermembrane receptor protein
LAPGFANGDYFVQPVENSSRYHDFSPMASLSYKFVRDVTAYMTWSRGFRSGGYDQRLAGPVLGGKPPAFGPEHVTSYEAGLKSELFDHRVRFNNAFFVTEYDNMQLSTIRPDGAPATQNAGDARILGFESELSAVPLDNLETSLSAGYLDAHYTRLSGEVTGLTLDTRLPNVPSWQLSASLGYDFNLGGVGTITPRVDWSYTSSQFLESSNDPASHQGGYQLLNVSLHFRSADGKWVLSFAGKNVTDAAYRVFTSTNRNVIDSSTVVYGRPRELLVTLKREF